MGLSCYEQNAEVIQDLLMSTEEDDDFKAGLIALASIVAGLQNPPKSDGERNDSAALNKICPVCQSNIQLSMYSGEGKGSGALPDGEHNNRSTKLLLLDVMETMLNKSYEYKSKYVYDFLRGKIKQLRAML